MREVLGEIMHYHLTIAHLYPRTMGTYGDRGNILTLEMRCHWRSITVTVLTADIGEDIPPSDLYFWGGGQDQEQGLVSADLRHKKGAFLKQEAENYKPMLAICGGYQLMGRFYVANDRRIEGIGVLDLYTKAGQQRMTGNYLISLEATSPLVGNWRGEKMTTVVGFENHSGKTYLGQGVSPLGRVVIGYGNNGEDHWEGAVYKHVIGCYGHGPLLARNPHLADVCIQRALEMKYRTAVRLAPLDDSLEWKAHTTMVRRLTRSRFLRCIPALKARTRL